MECACGVRRFCPVCPLPPRAAGSHWESGPPAGHSGPTQSWKPLHGVRGSGAGAGAFGNVLEQEQQTCSQASGNSYALPGALSLPPGFLLLRASVSPSEPKPVLAWTPRTSPTTSPGSERSRGLSPLSPHCAERRCADRAHPHPQCAESHQPGSSRSSIRPFQPGFPKTSSPSDFLPKS